MPPGGVDLSLGAGPDVFWYARSSVIIRSLRPSAGWEAPIRGLRARRKGRNGLNSWPRRLVTWARDFFDDKGYCPAALFIEMHVPVNNVCTSACMHVGR